MHPLSVYYSVHTYILVSLTVQSVVSGVIVHPLMLEASYFTQALRSMKETFNLLL